MKIVFDRKKIVDAVAPLMNSVSLKNSLGAAEGILIDAAADGTCTLTTFDLEKGTRLCISAQVEEAGCHILNAQKFAQTVRVMEGETVTLTVSDKEQACVSSGKSSHRMNSLPGSSFPELPRLETENGFEIGQSVLKRMIGKAMYAMAVNDQRPILNGCYFKVSGDGLLVVSCDSFKMSRCTVQTEVENRNRDGSALNFSFIIPTKTVNELYKMLKDDERETVRIHMSRKNIVFQFKDLTFFSRLIDGLYIDFDKIISKNHRTFVTVNRERMIAALERAALVTEEHVAGSVRAHVKLHFDGDLVRISAVSTLGETYDEVPIEHDGEDLLIAFNNRFLIDSLKATDADEVRISLTTPLTSINIEPVPEEEGKTELFMLLPVRMKD